MNEACLSSPGEVVGVHVASNVPTIPELKNIPIFEASRITLRIRAEQFRRAEQILTEIWRWAGALATNSHGFQYRLHHQAHGIG